jgi:serine/threonine protein kinase
LTQEGAILGTPGFMPPEQAGEDLGAIGPHSDVYALGAILYSLLSGRPPFDEDTALKTIVKVISGETPPPLSHFRDDVPPELEVICLTCLNKKPEDRYPSAEALTKDLRRFRAGKAPHATQKKTQAGDAPTVPPPPPVDAPSPAVLIDEGTGKRIPLGYGDTLIGRSSDCDIVIRASDVSKRHCQIQYFSDTGAFVEDLKSINGTTINGAPIDRAPLRQGDKLGIAGHVFRVVFAKP